MKLCLIYNFAQHYRAGIFKRISEEFECEFYFGDSMSDVKKMDYSILIGLVHEMHTKRLGVCTYQNGVLGLLKKDYNTYILLGDTHSLSTWLFLLFAKFFSQKKVFLWSHGWYGKESPVERFLKKIFFKLPNGGVFLYGNYARNLMIHEGFKPEKLFTIHNSLDYEKQVIVRHKLHKTNIYKSHFVLSGYNIIFIGRLTQVKKLDMMIKALRLILDSGLDVNLTFVGDGIESKKLHALAIKMNLVDNIWFYGPCYDEETIGELIYNADICVSPGNVGLTAMHALVYGTPVITHNNYPLQMPEFEAIVEGKTGSFFDYDNVESLAFSIRNWLKTNDDSRDAIRQNCFSEIDHYWTPEYQMGVLRKQLIK